MKNYLNALNRFLNSGDVKVKKFRSFQPVRTVGEFKLSNDMRSVLIEVLSDESVFSLLKFQIIYGGAISECESYFIARSEHASKVLDDIVLDSIELSALEAFNENCVDIKTETDSQGSKKIIFTDCKGKVRASVGQFSELTAKPGIKGGKVDELEEVRKAMRLNPGDDVVLAAKALRIMADTLVKMTEGK